jgi:hypothetical protein
MVLNGWICCEIIFTTLVPRNSAFRPETQVSCQFTFQRIPKCSKHSQTWLLVRGIRMNAFGAKWFSQSQYLEIVHLRPKHKFCIFSHLKNVSKHSQKSFWVQSSTMDAFGVKTFSQLRYPKLCIHARNKSFLYRLHAKVFETLENNPNHYFLSNGVKCMHFVRNHICNIGAPK